ncbi:MAG: PadR family transcriptional regulator [Oscillospiraceae bacterium]|jgi:PadR family transcriptional regulator PadR|nr:PadR family transcriptional regulator [Oscillospiraceae bacterium]
MAFQIGSTMLDACVLAILAQGDTYGYRITQQIRSVVDVSESTLYPVLRRLQKDQALESYDRAYQGRNRRYYRLTARGASLYADYKNQWKDFRQTIDQIILGENFTKGGIDNDQN